MRRVICKDCKKVYDYDKDDFCPRCGSFNPPKSAGSTRLEQELLSRFGTARANQGRTAPPVQPPRGVYSGAPRQGAYSRPPQPQWRPTPKPNQGHRSHTPIGGRCDDDRPSASAGTVLAAVVSAAVLLTLLAAAMLRFMPY